MILSCPNCATQYTVNDAVIGMRGRTVRCTACKTTWHAETPVDLRYSEKKAEFEEEPERDLQSVKAKKLPGKYRAMLQKNARLRAVAVEGIVWGGLAVAAIAVLAIAYLLRVDIVKAFPRIAGAYAMVGMKVNPTGLEFIEKKQTAEVNFKGGRFVVTVKAQVRNVTDRPMPVPPVRVSLLNATLEPLTSVLMPAGGLVVAPHATRTLTFDVADPKNQVASLDLKFDLEAMKAMKGKPAGGHGAPHGDAGDDAHAPATAHGEDAAHEAEPAAHEESEPVIEAGAGHAPQALDHDAGPETAAEHEAVPPASEEAASHHPAPPLRPALTPEPHTAKKGHG